MDFQVVKNVTKMHFFLDFRSMELFFASFIFENILLETKSQLSISIVGHVYC